MTELDTYHGDQGMVVYDEPAIVPVADARPTWHEVGRIRVGVKVPTGRNDRNGKPIMRPGKLTRFRLTSPNQALIEHAAERYGGDPVPWDDAPGADREGGEQWQVLTTSSTLPVLIPPAAAATQAFESWSGGGCERRCDGRWELYTGGPCICIAEAEEAADAGATYERPCRLTTRLSVMLPELPGTGIWRLETHSAISGNELATWLRIVFPHLPAMAPLVLRVEKAERTRRIPDPKAPKGWRPQTFVFPLISIDTRDTTIGQLLEAGGHRQMPAPPPVAEVAGRVLAQTADPAPPAPPGPGPAQTSGPDAGVPRAPSAEPGPDLNASEAGTGDTGATQPTGHEPPAAEAATHGSARGAGASPPSPSLGDGDRKPGRRRRPTAGPITDAAPAGPDQPALADAPIEERAPVVRWCLANRVQVGLARAYLAGEHASEFGADSDHPLATTNDLMALEGSPADRAVAYLQAALEAGVFEPEGWRP